MLEDSHTHYIHSNQSDLKLLHLIWEHPDKVVGGMGVAGAALSDALSRNEGVEVYTVTPSSYVYCDPVDNNSYEKNLSIEDALRLQDVVETKQDLVGINGEIADFARQVYFASLAEPEKYDCSVVYAHDWLTAAAGVSIQRSKGVPLILHIHSTQIDRVGAHAKGAVFLHEMWAMQQADMIITVSDSSKNVIMEHYDIAEEKIHVIKNAIDVAEPKNGLLTDAFLSRKESIVMFAGRLVAQKYPEAAVEIITGALKHVSGARGVIAGGGEKLGVIRELVKFKGMEERIEVLGSVPYRNMHTVYEKASVLILPSLSEPFGLVALEAAKAGVAVLLSSRCGVSEVLRSSPVINPYEIQTWIDHTVKLLNDRAVREVQVLQQMDEIASYSWNDASRNLLERISDLVGK